MTMMKRPLPEPHLTREGKCSDCEVAFTFAGNGDYKICPECFAVLWHKDWGGELRAAQERIRLARVAVEKEKKTRREALKEAIRKGKKEMKAEVCDCESGKFRFPLSDGHGIFLAYVCDRCIDRKIKSYRPDIFTNYKPEEPLNAK